MLLTSELEYDLDPSLIATHPARPRDAARLLVVRRSALPIDPGGALESRHVEHRRVRDLPDLLAGGGLLGVNVTRVVPARFTGVRRDTSGKVEGLFLAAATHAEDATLCWRVLVRARRQKPGVVIDLEPRVRAGALGGDSIERVSLELLERVDAEEAGAADRGAGAETSGAARAASEHSAWLARVRVNGAAPAMGDSARVLEAVGLTPLPPYILARRARLNEESDDATDRCDYQTIFADASRARSVAAPTAGLHLTPEVLERVRAAGVRTITTTLHVSAGTFKPIESLHVEDHPMHAEWCELPEETRAALLARRVGGGAGRASGTSRLIAVGTTSARALESFSDGDLADTGRPLAAWTRLLITPGYAWKRVDGLLTNFHLPRSTLLAMVAAMLPGGVRQLRSLYEIAQRERYRFYSFGDAMLILP